MEGTAANNSMAVPRGRRKATGQVSVRNRAMPNDRGTAITSAMVALTTVPKMAIAAPNSSLTMSHSTRQRNSGPNLARAGQALMNRETMMPIRATRTSMENNHVILWKKKSCRRWRLTTTMTSAMERGACSDAELGLMSIPSRVAISASWTGIQFQRPRTARDLGPYCDSDVTNQCLICDQTR